MTPGHICRVVIEHGEVVDFVGGVSSIPETKSNSQIIEPRRASRSSQLENRGRCIIWQTCEVGRCVGKARNAPKCHHGAIRTSEVGDFHVGTGLRYCYVQAAEDTSSNGHTTDRSVWRRHVVVEVKRLLVGKSSKLKEIVPCNVVVDSSVMNVSDVDVVEDIVGRLETDLTVGKISGEERLEFIVKGLQLSLEAEKCGGVVICL